VIDSAYISVLGDNGKLMTGLDYNIIFNHATGVGFMSWTAKTSDAGHWAQVVDAEGGNSLIIDGSWKFWHNEGEYYNIRNHSAPKQSFLATSKSTGDATGASLFVEVSPDESTNKLAGNGSWKIAGTTDNYHLINKEFNKGVNFLTTASTYTKGGNGYST